MHPARRDETEIDGALPDPRLNPLINPRLGKNLGRWASVYYANPPEKREEAVLQLVRELENGTTTEQETEALSGKVTQEQPVTPRTPINRAGPETDNAEPHFCITCGSALKHRSEDPKQPTASLTLLPATRQIEAQSVATGTLPERRQARKHLAFFLIASAALGAWGVWHIRSAPLQPSGKAAHVPQRTTHPAQTHIESRDRARQAAPTQPERAIAPGLSKPPAGKPIGCAEDGLQNCPIEELRRRAVTLAAGIDALFVTYDTRMTQLLRDATSHTSDSALQKQNRLRRANYSAQLWEHSQLSSYASHLSNGAVKYRAELIRRVLVPITDSKMLNLYENPRSCLELHYIAQDLRRLANQPARLRSTVQTPPHNALNAPISH